MASRCQIQPSAYGTRLIQTSLFGWRKSEDTFSSTLLILPSLSLPRSSWPLLLCILHSKLVLHTQTLKRCCMPRVGLKLFSSPRFLLPTDLYHIHELSYPWLTTLSPVPPYPLLSSMYLNINSTSSTWILKSSLKETWSKLLVTSATLWSHQKPKRYPWTFPHLPLP